MAFAGIAIEFYEAPTLGSVHQGKVYGRLISSVADGTLSTVEHATIPNQAVLIRVTAAADAYVETGTGNQDGGSTRRSVVLAGTTVDFQVNPGDNTISYLAA